ncbi:MAG: AAA family ATPase [Bacteroidota bacterium]
MAYNVNITFQAFQLRLLTGESIIVPVSDMGSVRVEEAVHQVAGKYAESFQKSVLNRGFSLELLNAHKSEAYQKASVKIPFAKAKNGYSYPAFELDFDYYFHQNENGFHATIPILAIDAYSKKEETLAHNLKEAIQLEFKRNKRLQNIQDVLSVIWFESTELLKEEVLLRTLTPEEVEEQKEDEQKELLNSVAKRCTANGNKVYGRADRIEQILQALQNSFNRNVLLVGASGVGKTALIQEASERFKKSKSTLEIWETTASKMLKALMLDTGWQDNLSKLCDEMRGKDQMLFIRNLMELFEVGQYEGNAVSMAEYLRSYMSQGALSIISECTEEELQAIELRSPNYTNLFHIIRVNNPQKELEKIVIQKAKDLCRTKKISLEEEAIKEVIRLNSRYTPYSGLPGKPIRFIENLLLESPKQKQLSKSDIIQHFCEETGMPTFMVDPGIPMKVDLVHRRFNENIFGQHAAVEKVVDVLASVKTALTRKEKPIASFLFVGPTGVGKTELAKVLAEFMFNDRNRMLRFDMSEYSNPLSLGRLIGSFQTSGTLTAAVRRAPFCVLLFDEIEKADPKFFDLLLQILGEGRLTDNQGKLVNFCSTIIIMTSNIGANRPKAIGLNDKDETKDIVQHYLNAVRKQFRPELFGRIDEVIPFLPLSPEVIRHVVQREVQQLRTLEGIHYRPMQLDIEEAVLEQLGTIGYDAKYGARHLQRTLREDLILPLSRRLNLEERDDHLKVDIRLNEAQKIEVLTEVDPKGVERYLEEWDKMLNADYASELRRKMERLKDGLLYVELEDNLRRLENLKQRQKEEFWKDRKQTEDYQRYLECKEQVAKLLQKIEALENKLALSYMDLEQYEGIAEDQLSDWLQEFEQLKKHLYVAMHPESGQCYFGVYGTHLKEIIEFYIGLFKAKGFDYHLESVAFQEAYYQMQQNIEQEKEETQECYLLNLLEEKQVAQLDDSSFFGVRFYLQGECVHLYLESEQGMQKWKYKDKEEHRYWIEVHDAPFCTPKSIHRKEFYKRKNIARTVQPLELAVQDNSLDLKREYPKGQLHELIMEKLDEIFQQKLDGLLL